MGLHTALKVATKSQSHGDQYNRVIHQSPFYETAVAGRWVIKRWYSQVEHASMICSNMLYHGRMRMRIAAASIWKGIVDAYPSPRVPHYNIRFDVSSSTTKLSELVITATSSSIRNPLLDLHMTPRFHVLLSALDSPIRHRINRHTNNIHTHTKPPPPPLPILLPPIPIPILTLSQPRSPKPHQSPPKPTSPHS